MLVIMLCLSMFSEGDASYFLVLRQGDRIEIREAPRYEGKFAYFTLLDGEKSMVPIKVIDQDKTKAYNAELQEKREVDKVAETELTEPEEPQAEPKPIEIVRRSQIPVYSRDANITVSEKLPESASDATSDDVIGSPKISTWQKDDAFYISKETLTRRSNGWQIACEVTTNHPTGIKNITVNFTGHFDGGEQHSLTQSPEPAAITPGNNGLVIFNIETKADILRSDYTLSADLGAN